MSTPPVLQPKDSCDSRSSLPHSVVWAVLAVSTLPFVLGLLGVSFGSASIPLDSPGAPSNLSDALHRNLAGSFQTLSKQPNEQLAAWGMSEDLAVGLASKCRHGIERCVQQQLCILMIVDSICYLQPDVGLCKRRRETVIDPSGGTFWQR